MSDEPFCYMKEIQGCSMNGRNQCLQITVLLNSMFHFRSSASFHRPHCLYNSQTLLCNTHKLVLSRGSANGIDGNAEVAVGSVLETDREGRSET